MISKLYEFCFLDHRARLQAYGWIAFIAFVYGALNSIAFGRPEREVTWEVVGLVGLLTLVWAAWYVLQAQKPISEPRHTAREWTASKLFCRPAWACAVMMFSLLFITLLRLPSTRIEAIKADRLSPVGAASPLAAAAKYAKEGKTELAVKATQQAVHSIAAAATEKKPASPRFFADTIEMINSVARAASSTDLSEKLQDARLSLAQYQSSLQVIGTIKYSQKLLVTAKWTLPNKYKTVGGYLDISKVPGNFATPVGYTNLAEAHEFQGTIISGGMQTLDNIRWVNVTFVGTKIRYNGGDLYLDHVRFIGCTFEAPDNDRGAKFAEYAALLLPTLKIG
jgi:hypothetical protein